MSTTNKRQQKGMVLLLAVLIMGTVALIAGTSIALASIWQVKSRITSASASRSKNAADACVDGGLQRIHDNTSYTGTSNFTVGSDSCSVTVTNTGGSTRRIEAQSTVNSITTRRRVNLSVTTTISITDSNYVDSF